MSAAAWTLVAAFAIYVMVIAPFRGQRAYRRLAAQRGDDPKALLRFYRRNVARQWLLLIPVALIVIVSPHVGPRDLGLAWPHAVSYVPWQLFVEFNVVIAVSSLVYRNTARRGVRIPGQSLFRTLIPQTEIERQWACGVAVTAGITEEVLFRGLILNAGIWSGLPIVVALVVSSVLFGAAHIYQGIWGAVMATMIGLLFGWLYLTTLSLAMPMVLHTLIDLRALVLVRSASSGAPHALPEMAPAPQRSVVDDRQRPLIRKAFPTE